MAQRKKDEPEQTEAEAPEGPTVYCWAMWREGAHGFRRVRAHVPLAVVLQHAVSAPNPPDLFSRVVGGIAGELAGETVQRGDRWTR